MISDCAIAADAHLVAIPGGTFAMGAGADDKFATDTERPVRSISVVSFSLGAFPVTVGEFRRFMPTHESDAPAAWPVVNVDWFTATEYCVWLSETSGRRYRLPTEVEWEYACRAGSTTVFHTGTTLSLDAANFLYTESGERLGPGARLPVGSFPPNAFGLYDMHGNVCEWVADRWTPTYAESETTAAADLRVIRGGAWDHLPRLLRSAWRDGLPAHARYDNVGFRLAANVEDDPCR